MDFLQNTHFKHTIVDENISFQFQFQQLGMPKNSSISQKSQVVLSIEHFIWMAYHLWKETNSNSIPSIPLPTEVQSKFNTWRHLQSKQIKHLWSGIYSIHWGNLTENSIKARWAFLYKNRLLCNSTNPTTCQMPRNVEILQFWPLEVIHISKWYWFIKYAIDHI